MNIKRRLLCGLLNLHVGPIETAKAETWQNTLAVRVVRCKRCGEVHPVDAEPYGDMVARIEEGIEA